MRKVGYGYESAMESYSMEWISQKKVFRWPAWAACYQEVAWLSMILCTINHVASCSRHIELSSSFLPLSSHFWDKIDKCQWGRSHQSPFRGGCPLQSGCPPDSAPLRTGSFIWKPIEAAGWSLRGSWLWQSCCYKGGIVPCTSNNFSQSPVLPAYKAVPYMMWKRFSSPHVVLF